VLKAYDPWEVKATMPLSVRRATQDDTLVIVEFNRLLAEESEGKTLDLPLLTAGVVAGLADPPKALYFLAEEDGNVLGLVMVTFEWSDWRNGWFWWIQSVYVRQEARRRGVFRALFEHLLQAARDDATVIGLRLYVEGENQTAHQTYERLGMAWTTYHVMERYPL
jgi:GNAT superfamily N-acetyltransferase